MRLYSIGGNCSIEVQKIHESEKCTSNYDTIIIIGQKKLHLPDTTFEAIADHSVSL